MELQGNLHKQTLVYSMVARRDVVVAEYSPLINDLASFNKQAVRFIHNLRPSGRRARSSAVANVADSTNMFCFTCDSHTFHFLTQDEFIFLVVSSGPDEKQIASAFLQHIQADFYKSYRDETITITNLRTHNIYKDYRSHLRDHMQYFMGHSQRLIKLASINDEIQEEKDNAVENNQKALDVESCTTKGDQIITVQEVENFHMQGEKLKRQMWIQQTKVRVVAVLVSITIVFTIWLLVCNGFEC